MPFDGKAKIFTSILYDKAHSTGLYISIKRFKFMSFTYSSDRPLTAHKVREFPLDLIYVLNDHHKQSFDLSYRFLQHHDNYLLGKYIVK